MAIRFKSGAVIRRCVDIVARNFPYIYGADWSLLPFKVRFWYFAQFFLVGFWVIYLSLSKWSQVFFRILDNDRLAAKPFGEYKLYEIVRDYVNARSDADPDTIRALFGTIR